MERRNFFSLALIVAVGTFYSQTENNWFNSWVSNIVGEGEFQVGLMIALSGIVGAVFFIVFGSISDNIRSKYGRRKPVLIIGLLSSAVFVIIFGITKNYIGCLIIDGVILGITGNMMWSSRHSLVPDLSEMKDRGKLNSNLFIIGILGGAVSQIIEIIAPLDENNKLTEGAHLLVFYLTAIGLIVCAVVVFFTLEEPLMETLPEKRKWYRDIKNIFNYEELRSHKEFYKFFIALLFLIIAKNAYFPYLINLKQEFGFDPVQKLFFSVAMGIGTFLGYSTLARISDKYGRKKVTLTFLPFGILGMILCALIIVDYIAFYLGTILIFFIFEGLQAVQDTWSQDLADEEARGKFLGILNITQSAGKAPGAIFAGLFADMFGIWSIYVTAAIFVLISLPLYRRVEDRVIEFVDIDTEKTKDTQN
jgi:MFS family permease